MKSGITISHLFQCSAPGCNSTHEELLPYVTGMEVSKPILPVGWHVHFGYVVYPKHKVTFRVDDGKEFPLP